MLKTIIRRFRLFLRIQKAKLRWTDDRFWEKEIFLLRFLLEGGTALDVGANKGLYSIMLSKCADKVIAFEPNPLLAEMLTDTLPKNCEVRALAVSAKTGRSKLKIPHTNSGRSIANIATLEPLEGSATHLKVETVALDDLDEKAIKFIKVDVEGHEHQVIAGAKNLIREQRPIVMLEINDSSKEEAKSIFDFFDEENYIALQLRNRTLAALNKEPGVLYYRNVLFLPKTAFDKLPGFDQLPRPA